MNVYDFDKTIYDGDSSVDFYLYCLKRNPLIIMCLPIQLFAIIQYKLKLKNKNYMKEKFFCFLKKMNNVDKVVEDFWSKKRKKIKKWYLNQKKNTDIIISASPEFLLNPICNNLKINKLIASKVNKHTGKFEGENCRGEEKVKRFRKEVGSKEISKFYSDSMSDAPMMNISKKSFLVKKNKIREIKADNEIENKNNKNEVKFIFFFFLLVYFIISFTLMYLYNTGKYVNVLFDMDTRRAFSDMAIRLENHYRVSVHPLFVIINQPIVYVLKTIIRNDMLSVSFLLSFVGAACAALFNKVLQKINISSRIRLLITFMFGISYSQLIYSTLPETYIEACLFALLGWYYFIKVDTSKEYTVKNYIVLYILGLLGLSAILTNYLQFFIMSTVLIYINKNEKDKIAKIIFLNMVVVLSSIALAQVQNYIWPSANNYFFSHINGILSNTDEEYLYMNRRFGIRMFINVFKPLFLYNFNISRMTTSSTQVVFKDNKVLDCLSLIAFATYFVSFIRHCLKHKVLKNKNEKENMFFILMNLILVINIVFHFVYGNSTAFLYVASFTFALFISIAIMLNKTNIKDFIIYIMYLIAIVLFFINFSQLLYFFNRENVLISGSSISKIGPIIIGLLFILFIYVLIKNKKMKYFIFLLFVIGVIANISLFVIPRYKNNEFPEYYEWKYKTYKKQMLDLKGALAVYYVSEENTDFYFFGMATDEKYAYKDGKLIDIINGYKTVLEYDIEKELIIPNEYTVLLKTKDNSIIKIFENEDGLFVEENGNIKTIFEHAEKLNLPNFEDKYYSEILKVLHQETLFNFYDSKQTPCVFTYKRNSWYRDAMLMTMVLEKTDNVSVAKKWVDTVTTVYDNQRESKESDNLGELLYVLYATKSDDKKLINSIIEEIKRIKEDDGTIPSNIDGFVQRYYPTAIAKFALDKYGIDLGLVVPDYDDGYAKLTWYTDKRIYSNSMLSGELFPYLSWAEYHYDNTNYLSMFNKFYPLSYESAGLENKNIFEMLKEGKVSAPHGWASAEMFLFIYDEGNKYSYSN